jgi:ABC-type Mn2+/Zn2+ transport system ATPase subunit
MVHHWLKATEGSGATVCVVLFDYEKAFDLTDHNLLLSKKFSTYINSLWCRILGNCLFDQLGTVC